MTLCHDILAQVWKIFIIFARRITKFALIMRRLLLTMGLTLAVLAVDAQSPESDYIVKTKGVEKPAVESVIDAGVGVQGTLSRPLDFVSRYFRYYSLCEWFDGMRFMVLPEKYDMIVKTFCDAKDDKEVSSLPLRYHIMAYKGHTQDKDGHERINFHCETNNKDYYYVIPNGSFDDYCYGKNGVPTLAYLGDVDIARKQLIGKKVVLKSTVYLVDTDGDSDGFKEVRVTPNKEVTVVNVGVGTRNFPVKIIVEDEYGNQFYQNVSISGTNSGMRDEEFIHEKARNAFYSSFGMPDDIMAVAKDITTYIGKTIHSKVLTSMVTRGDGRERTVRVPKMTTFIVDNISQIRNGKYATLSLTEAESRRPYFKEVSFVLTDEVLNDSVQLNEYFGYLFAMGEGAIRETSQAARAAIRAGRVTAGMTEDEVILAMGEDPDRKENPGSDGRYRWHYKRSSGTLTVVFGRNGMVEQYITPDENRKMEASKKKGTKTRRK